MTNATSDTNGAEGIAKYDPATGQPSTSWDALTNDERLFIVTAWHKQNRGDGALLHPDTIDPRRHGLKHVLVENMVVAKQPQALQCIEALMAKGLSRHETIHAIAAATSTYMLSLATVGAEFTEEGFANELTRIDANFYFNTAPDA